MRIENIVELSIYAHVHSMLLLVRYWSCLKIETKETLINQKSQRKAVKGKSGMDFYQLDQAMRDASIPSSLSKTTR